MSALFRIIIIIGSVAVILNMHGLVLAVPPGKTIAYDNLGDKRIIFDGKSHASAGLRCNDCHPKIFQMKKGSNNITMSEINSGRKCGVCHNGNKASLLDKAKTVPKIVATASFFEPSGNSVLDAGENGIIRLQIENKSMTETAYNVTVTVTTEKRIEGLEIQNKVVIPVIRPGETVRKEIDIKRDKDDLKTGDVKLIIVVTGDNILLDNDRLTLFFKTQGPLQPDLHLDILSVEDKSGSGKIEPAEIVKITVRIRNRGKGAAVGVEAIVKNGAKVFFTDNSRTEFRIGDMEPGTSKDITFSFYTEKDATDIPLSIELSEIGRSKFNKTEHLNLAFNHQYSDPKESVILGLSDVEDLLKNGVSNKRVVALIRKHGISFVDTKQNIEFLKTAGANDTVIDAVNTANNEYKNKLGDLYVESNPAGSAILLDRKYIGLTPFTIENLTVGEKELAVVREGYRDYKKIITIESSKLKKEVVFLEPIIILTIVTTPPDAKIFVSGALKGVSPLTLKDLNKGEYSLKVEREGYKTKEDKVFLSNRSETLNVTLEKTTTRKFLERKDFSSDKKYEAYIKENIAPGMKVRAIDTVYKLKKGAVGTYWGSTIGDPPAFVIWDEYLGYDTSYHTLKDRSDIPKGKEKFAFWVYWYQIEILDDGYAEEKVDRVKQESFHAK